MSLTKWANPDVMFPAFSNVFDEFLGDFSGRAGGSLHRFVPAVNVMENEDEFLLEVAVPGMNREAFNMHVDHKQLTISASQPDENEKKGKYARKEFSYHSFKRTFALPDFVDVDKIHATYEEGLLKIVVPKREEVKPRTIQIS